MCNVGEAIEHVELFVAALQELVVCRCNDLTDSRLFQVFYHIRCLLDVEVQKLVQKLLTVVALQYKVFSYTLNVRVGCTSRSNDCCYHQNSFLRHAAGDTFDIRNCQACLFCETRTSLQQIYASTQISICKFNKPVNDIF